MDEQAKIVIAEILAALKAAKGHLEYCGYGRDAWERECAGDLEEVIEKAILAGEKLT